MGKSKLRVSAGLLEALLLEPTTRITGIEIASYPAGTSPRYVVLSIEGPDVPDAPEVRRITSKDTTFVPTGS